MDKATCIFGWDPKLAEKERKKNLVFIDTDPQLLMHVPQSEKLRLFIVNEQNRYDILRKIAWSNLFVSLSFQEARSGGEDIMDELKQISGEIQLFASDFADQGETLTRNVLKNLAEPLLDARALFGAYKNIPAVVCGAGPSLAHHVDFLKSAQKNSLLFAGGAATEALRRLSITPHFNLHVDPNPNHSFLRTSPNPLPTFVQLRTSHAVVQKITGPKLLLPATGNFPLETWAQGHTEIFDGGWTVGTCGVATALALGCNPIILVGMDLSGTPAQMYAGGIKNEGNFIEYQGRLTRPDWIRAAAWLSETAKKHSDRTWLTLSEGLPIEGIRFGSYTLPEITLPKLPELPKPPLFPPTLVMESLGRSLSLIQNIIAEMKAIFPQTPDQSGTIALLHSDLEQELAYKTTLAPIWEIWKFPLSRHNPEGSPGLFLHQMLFFTDLIQRLMAKT
ncbi:MAG: DUF115 domain-containing protein [Verrucomicrobia bacterium]|nr:DUF115 domain-containing protein [Verrucomicrobiota bacterium]